MKEESLPVRFIKRVLFAFSLGILLAQSIPAMKVIAVAAGLGFVSVYVSAEMVEEEVITLDPSGMVHRSKVMVEKKTGTAPEKKEVVIVSDKTEETEPFLTEERVNRFARYKDCWVDDNRICLKREPVQGADGCIVLEAEEAKTVQPEEGRVAVGFDEADGCRYVAFLTRAEYVFEVKTDGAYQSWHRCWFPVRGNWSQSETLDREPPRGVVDSVNGKQPDKEWVWVKGPIYNLKAGNHRLVLDYHAGARLDRIVLAPEAYEPKGKGPSVTYNTPAATARIETVTLNPLAITKWYRLNLNTLGGGGQVEAHYSLDAGKTWKPVPSNGDLQAIGAGPQDSKELKLAFELKSSTDGTTPILIGPALKFVGAQPLAFGNDKIELLFSTSKGSIVGIRNLQSRQECMLESSQTYHLVDLSIIKDKALKGCPEPILKAQGIEETKNGKVLTQKYQWFEGKIEAVVTVTLGDSGKVFFNLKLNNQSEDPIVHVDFPRLSGMRIGAKGADNYFCIPMLMGNNLFRDPGNSPRLWNYTQQYPWANPMKWVDLWDSSGGLYVASHDTTFRDTAMLVGGTPHDSISLLFRKLVHVAPGKDWVSEPYCVATHPSDWHWAAREYGAWARTCLKSPDNPRWFKEEFDGFMAGPAYGAFPFNGFMNARRVVEEDPARERLVDEAANRQGFDAMAGYCTLYPYPNPAWGGMEEFAQACDMIQQVGGHSIWYINWLLTNPRYATLPRIGAMAKKLLPSDTWQLDSDWMERTLARAPSGEYVSTPPPPDAVYYENKLCDETEEFSKYKVFWAEKYVRDFHADGIYWDCLLYSYGPPCYHPAHHVNGNLGNWGNASMETLRKMVGATRALNPHAFYMGEGMSMIGVSQYENLSAGSINSEVYRYTFPDWVLGGGRWSWGDLSPESTFEYLNNEFLCSVRVMNQDIRMSGGKLPAGIAPDYSMQLLHLRKLVKPLLYSAIFRDMDGLAIELPAGYEQKSEIEGGGTGSPVPCGILIPGNGIRAKRYTLERDSTRVELLNVINTDKKEGAFLTLKESTLKSVKKVWAFDLGGELKEIPLKRGAAMRIPVPVSLASTVVLVENCEPMLTIQAPSYGAWGEKIPVKVKVLNLNDRPISGRLHIGKRNGFSSCEVKYGPIAPGEEKRYDLDVVPGARDAGWMDSLVGGKGLVPGRHDLEMIAEGDGLKANRLFWVYIGNPLRLAIYPAAERLGVNVQLENFSGAPIEGTCTLVKDDVFKTVEPSFTFKVQPGEKTKVVMPLDLKVPLDMVRLARVEVKYGQCTAALVKSVVPPVPNPGFEIDIAGDGHPDFWMGRCQPGDPVIGYSQWGLDRQDKHSGNASVWLNPPGLNQTSTALAGAGGMAHFGKKYRVKVAIKREKVSDKIYALFACSGGSVTLGQKGNTGVWEEFEGTLSTAKTSADPFQWGDIDAFWTRLENGSAGKVWFDSIRVEEIP